MMSARSIVHRTRIGTRCVWGLAAILTAALAVAGCAPTREIAWSPDGRQIAYAPDGTLRIHDVATGRDRVLKLKVGVSNYLWSPDGKCIAAYTAPEGTKGNPSLIIIDPVSGRVQTLAQDTLILPKEKPAAKGSPGNAREQTQNGVPDWYAVVGVFGVPLGWSPDGAQLVYVRVALSGSTVTMLGYPTGTAKPIVRIAGAVIGLAWSPDGSRIAYIAAHETQQGQSLWLYDVASGKSEKVCDVPRAGLAPDTSLQWSPDSKRIGFITGGGDEQIGTACVVEAHPGAKPARYEGITTAAAWSPDLRGIAFVEQREHDGEEIVLLFRGVHPITRRVIGAIRVPTDELSSNSKQTDGEESLPSDYSLPAFSADGRRVALRVGDRADTATVAVFDVVVPSRIE
jgi:WD40 repeat protein